MLDHRFFPPGWLRRERYSAGQQMSIDQRSCGQWDELEILNLIRMERKSLSAGSDPFR
jgi:hypothetical protein